MASCNDCIHYNLCRSISRIQLGWRGNSVHYVENVEEICKDFKARARFVELPCKVGDSVFTIDNKENIQECTVINVNCKTQLTLDKKLWIDFIIVTEPVDDSLPFPMIFTYSIAKNQILFLTKEAAEQALKEREA